jgi:putative DNA primase/helicase
MGWRNAKTRAHHSRQRRGIKMAESKIKGDRKITEAVIELAQREGLISPLEGPDRFFTEDKEHKFIPKRLGDYIKEDNHFKTLIGNEKEIYHYKDGYYQKNGIAFIKQVVTDELGDEFKEHNVYEVVHYIINTTFVEPNSINNGYINFKNGLFNLSNKELIPHTPDVFSIQQIPYNYDKDARCNFFIEKLKERCDESTYILVQELFGYCFIEDNRFEKAFMFYGPKRTFKSTLLTVLNKVIGEENIQAMSLQYLTEDKHAVSFLYGCPANICGDISARELKNTGTFLKLTGKDLVTSDKKFKDLFTFRSKTKLIFSCNVVPPVYNKDDAFYRRWCMLNFKVQKHESEIDYQIDEKLHADLPGIFNWAMEGYNRLLKNNKLSYVLSDDETKSLYERNSDSISSFIYLFIDYENDSGEVIKREVYQKYLNYCKENILNPANAIAFGKKFLEITGCGTKKLNYLPAYCGVSFKNLRGEIFGSIPKFDFE